jgi:hypothetical protein
MKIIQAINNIVFLVLCLFCSLSASAQVTSISGKITEASTGDPLPNVTVSFKGTTIVTRSNAQGEYKISITGPATVLKFNYIGLIPLTREVKPGRSQSLDVKMQEDLEHLSEVNISTAKHGRYRNKDNPAVDLIRQVIDHKPNNRVESYPAVQYRQYDRLQISLSNLSDRFAKKKLFRNYQYLFQRQDSSQIGGKLLLPIFLQEKISENYHTKNPDQDKSIITANKQVRFDSLVIDNKGLSTYLERMYADINIYDNNVLIATTQFLSPIAGTAPTFYKYFITDTIVTPTSRLIELSFFPRNPADLLLEGKLYIADNGSYAVDKVFMTISNRANLNFVRGVEVKQEFKQLADKKYYLHRSALVVDFGINQNKGRGFTGQRTQVIEDFQTQITASNDIFLGAKSVEDSRATQRSADYWSQNRLERVSDSTLKIYDNIDSLGKSKSFKQLMTVASVLFNGYYNAGPYEVGPIYTFYSFNSLEGLKLRLGGRTTTAFSSRYFLEGYLGYGFKDERWKGLGSVAYSLNNKSIYTYPQSFLRASVQRDTYVPGQELRGNTEDDFISSFRRGVNNRYLYNDFYKFEYVQEFENRFSFNLGFRKWKQQPAAALEYYTIDAGNKVVIPDMTTSEFNITLRYAPNEKFYQGKRSRVAVNNKYPIFNFRYAAGIKGLLGGEYNYHNFYGTIDKRVYMSQLGISDVKIEGGYILGKLPYPLLAIHKANQSYAYQINAYNLMNFLEFVSDQYASINIDHGFGGFFLNKVPLLKRLQLREFVSLKAVYGGVREENNPDLNQNLPQFQTNAVGQRTTYIFGNTPYVEGSVGLGNILKFLRVDLVRRFNYLDHPNVPKYGIRAKFKVDL